MRCQHCAHEIEGPGIHRFCPFCGNSLEVSESSSAVSGAEPTGAYRSDSAGPLPHYGGAGVPDDPTGRRSGVGLAVGALGAVLLLVVGVFAVRGFQGTSTGASSPDDLVSQLTSAIEKEDPAAAIALLDPKELPELGNFYKTSVNTAIKNASGDDSADVDQLRDAIDLDVGGLEHATTYLDQDHQFAKIGFSSGTISWASHPEKLPEWAKTGPDADRKAIGESETGTENLADLRVEDDQGRPIDPFFVAVRDNGRWYISVTMTLGEYLVETTGAPAGNFDAPPEPGEPAASPREAIKTLLEGAGNGFTYPGTKGPGLIGLLPENETRAFRIYRRALDGNFMQSETSTFDSGGDPIPSDGPDEDFTDEFPPQCADCGVSIDKLDVSTRRQGDLTYAVIDSATASTAFQDCSWSWSDEGGVWENYDPNDATGDAESPSPYPSDCSTEHGTITWDGHCVSSSGYDGLFGYGSDFSDEGSSYEFDSRNPSAGPPDTDTTQNHRACLDDELGSTDLTLADFGIVDVHVVVSQERGGWVVDPIATILDYGRTAISHLNDPKVQQAFDN